MRMGRVRRVHFVGVGGSGMSGIAEVLFNLGYKVSGSDLNSGTNVLHLSELGIPVHIGHSAEAVRGVDVVVVSTAIPETNPEIVRARQERIPIIPRAEMLGELMRMKYAVAIAGSHGKTSTTAMLATVLTRCGLDPTVVIGGRLGILGANAKLGKSDLMVAEADESDGSFMRLFPTLAVVTGIDREHLEHYGSYEAVQNAFVDFLAKVPFYGQIIACLDDPGVRAILERLDRRVVTYGLSSEADFQATEIDNQGFEVRFRFTRSGASPVPVRLQTPGAHQVQNALAALAVAEELGLSLPVAAAALDAFPGADRRMQHKGESRDILVLDDYGHHPREILATLTALRDAIGERRMLVLFQPHRYSRLEALFDDFKNAFQLADCLVLTDLYAAGEAARPGIDSDHLARAVTDAGHPNASSAGPLEDAIDSVVAQARPEDVILTLGAGSIGGAADAILERLRRGEGGPS